MPHCGNCSCAHAPQFATNVTAPELEEGVFVDLHEQRALACDNGRRAVLVVQEQSDVAKALERFERPHDVVGVL